MKIYSYLIAVLFLLNSLSGYSQIKTPAPSPTATLSQEVGLVDFEVNYSRPGMKDRVIFGDLVPYGEVWRTGANRSTKIKFNDSVNIGGTDVRRVNTPFIQSQERRNGR